MPLDDEYGPQIHSSNADLQNVSSDSAAYDLTMELVLFISFI